MFQIIPERSLGCQFTTGPGARQVNLPSAAECAAIFDVHLKRRQRRPAKIDLQALAGRSEDCSGAASQAVVGGGLYRAFDEGGRESTADDVDAALSAITPLPKLHAADIAQLQTLASANARPAQAPYAAQRPLTTATHHIIPWRHGLRARA